MDIVDLYNAIYFLFLMSLSCYVSLISLAYFNGFNIKYMKYNLENCPAHMNLHRTGLTLAIFLPVLKT